MSLKRPNRREQARRVPSRVGGQAVAERRPAHIMRRAGWVGLLARLVLGGVLVVAGALKAIDPQVTVRAVRGYGLLPGEVAALVGQALPFVELGLGLLLLAGALTRVAAICSAALLLAFVVAVSSAWARGLSIDCGCFGVGGRVSQGAADYVSVILRDLALLAAAGWLIVRPETPLAVDRPVSRSSAPELDPSELSDPSARVVG